MQVKSLLKFGLIFVVVLYGVGYTAFLNADQTQYRVKYCKDAECNVTSDVLTLDEFAALKQMRPVEKEESLYDLIGLFITASIPIVGILWWIINIQQDKKNLEQNIKYENELNNKLEKILVKQETIIDDFTGVIEKINNKMDILSQQVSAYQIESVKSIYIQNGKIDVLNDSAEIVKKLTAKLEDIESYLKENHQYKIRHSKKELE